MWQINSSHCQYSQTLVPTLQPSDLTPPQTTSDIPANTDKGATPYTIPAITLTPTTHLQDSAKIAPELEKLQPTPSLHLDSPILPRVSALVGEIAGPLIPFWMPLVPKNLLNPPSAAYFERTRAEKLGKPLSELAKDATDEQWAKCKEPTAKMAALLKENSEKGPFFMGETVSYADFVLVSAIHFFKRVDESYFERFVGSDDAFGKLYEACGKWLERDD